MTKYLNVSNSYYTIYSQLKDLSNSIHNTAEDVEYDKLSPKQLISRKDSFLIELKRIEQILLAA